MTGNNAHRFGIHLLIAPGFFAGGWSQSSAPFFPDDIRLTWSADPRTTQTISWRTGPDVGRGDIRFAAADRPFSTIEAPPPEPLSTNIGTVHLFRLVLRDLKPGTLYRYQIGSGTRWSGELTFQTAPEKPERFQFLVFGDSHEKQPDYSVWKETVESAYRQNPSARFLMNVGDLIYSGKDFEQWRAWLTSCREVLSRIPQMPVIGDHEPRGVTSKDLWVRPEYFVKLFPVPPNGPQRFRGEVYSFDYGYAHFTVLNSSFHYEFREPEARAAMIREQVEWLDRDLAATGQPWKIVVYHDATYNLAADRSGTLTKEHFGPILDKHHVDIVFNGHDHAVARSFFLRGEEPVADAARGTIYFIAGRSGNNAKDSLGPKFWHSFFYDPQGKTCYLSVEVDQDRLAVQTRLQDGTRVDTLEINRRDPAISTPVVPFGPYQSARFAAFGRLLTFGKPPRQTASGDWLVDAEALAVCLSGSYDPKSRIFLYDEGEIRLDLSGATPDADPGMASLAGLAKLGFYGRYLPSLNMVSVERWRD